MIEQFPWIERRFSFDLPPGLFPGLLERLRGTPARLEERLLGHSRALLLSGEGQAWSIQEHAGHLLEVESLWQGRLDDFAAGAEQLRPADMSNRRTISARYNERALDEILAGFRKQRFSLVERLEELDESAVVRSALHPRLARPMRVLDLMFFAAEHDDHHLARIGTLMSKAVPGAD